MSTDRPNCYTALQLFQGAVAPANLWSKINCSYNSICILSKSISEVFWSILKTFTGGTIFSYYIEGKYFSLFYWHNFWSMYFLLKSILMHHLKHVAIISWKRYSGTVFFLKICQVPKILYENFCMIIVLITREINITFVDTYHYANIN